MSRSSAVRGDVIELTAVFQDNSFINADPDAGTLTVSIYPPGKDPRLGYGESDAWVFEATLTGGGTGSEADSGKLVEKVSTGVYKYNFTVPDGAGFGSAFDQWYGVVDSAELQATLFFVIVQEGTVVGDSLLLENNIVFIELDETIEATDESTLESTELLYFTTTYNPLYSSVRRIRLDMGPLASDLYDDTINLAIFEASLSANEMNYAFGTGEYFNYARREYTTCLAEQTLYKALSGDSSIFGKMSKHLADLKVFRASSPQLEKNLEDLGDCIEKWARIIQSGGEKGTYTSIMPGISVKGANSVDAIAVARQWQPMSGVDRMPAANQAGRGNYYSSRKGRKGFKKDDLY